MCSGKNMCSDNRGVIDSNTTKLANLQALIFTLTPSSAFLTAGSNEPAVHQTARHKGSWPCALDP